MYTPPANVDDRARDDDAAAAPAPSPFDDQTGPLTFRVFAWRAALVLLLGIISLTVIVSGSWIVMRLYR